MSVREIKFFGGMRSFCSQERFTIELDDEATTKDLRHALLQKFDQLPSFTELLSESAVATSQGILREEDLLPPDQAIAILPPVCGG